MSATATPASAQASGSTTAAKPSPAHELKTLVLSRHPLIVIESAEEERVEALVAEVAADLRVHRFEWTVTRGLIRAGEAQAVYGTEDPGALARNVAALSVEAIYLLKDLAPHLASSAGPDAARVSRALRDTAEAFSAPGRLSTLVIAGASVDLPAELDAVAVRYRLALPGPEDYRRTVLATLQWLEQSGQARVEIHSGDVEDFVAALNGMTLNGARQALAHVALEDGRFSREDLARLAERKAHALRDEGLLEYFPPAENAAQLGGFARLRGWLDRARTGFTSRAAELGLQPPRGLMIVGVQGCGKSLACKTVARDWGLPLLKLDAGRLYDKYIGETERNFRRATELAESMAPCVLWIDEIEKAMAQGSDSDGGVSRRIFGSFLTWMQEKKPGVFVVATANDLSALPPELLRKGRFDEIFFVDLPVAAERQAILEIHLRLRRQDPATLDLPRLVAASEGFSGAELEQAVIASLYRSLHEGRELSTELLEAEMQGTVPLSVTRREDVERLRATAQERFVPVR
ncbi:MAG: AAA family ATPase [Actinomycetota bacterium]